MHSPKQLLKSHVNLVAAGDIRTLWHIRPALLIHSMPLCSFESHSALSPRPEARMHLTDVPSLWSRDALCRCHGHSKRRPHNSWMRLCGRPQTAAGGGFVFTECGSKHVPDLLNDYICAPLWSHRGSRGKPLCLIKYLGNTRDQVSISVSFNKQCLFMGELL